ncbi:MAG: hypothetical protein NTY77_11790 [Elusimicrobia bacterium]|nr:hypothetical protein [Elusimicrobiota bacterium]
MSEKNNFMPVSLLALTCLLAAASASAAPAAAQAQRPIEGNSDWERLKREDRGMSQDYLAYWRKNKLASSKDQKQLEALVRQIWTLTSKIESGQKSSRTKLEAAIDGKASHGSLDSATAKDLKMRLKKIYLVRMYYLYGNKWRQMMLEGFDTTGPATISSILGERIKAAISSLKTSVGQLPSSEAAG